MAASKVVFNNTGNIVLVQCMDNDVVTFISDLKSNLDEFKLNSYDSARNAVVFSCTCHNITTKADYNANYTVRVSDKVLIKDRRIVDINVGNLLTNNLITLE